MRWLETPWEKRSQVQDPSPIYDLRRANAGSSAQGTMGGRVARCLLQDRAVRLPAFIIRKRSREHARAGTFNIDEILHRGIA